MKNIFITALTFILWAKAHSQITTTEAIITINGNTTREELGVLAKSCHDNGFDFNYHPSFDAQRRLTGIKYTLSTADHSVKGEGEHMKLQAEGASIVLRLNKSKGTFKEDLKGK